MNQSAIGRYVEVIRTLRLFSLHFCAHFGTFNCCICGYNILVHSLENNILFHLVPALQKESFSNRVYIYKGCFSELEQFSKLQADVQSVGASIKAKLQSQGMIVDGSGPSVEQVTTGSSQLGKEFTHPIGAPNITCFRLVGMYSSVTVSTVKGEIEEYENRRQHTEGPHLQKCF